MEKYKYINFGVITLIAFLKVTFIHYTALIYYLISFG